MPIVTGLRATLYYYIERILANLPTGSDALHKFLFARKSLRACLPAPTAFIILARNKLTSWVKSNENTTPPPANFKRFSDTELNFCDPETGLAKDLIVLVGENGAGKSSILQAIAAMLGCATGRLDSPASLVWPGFDWDLIDQTWSDSSEIELTVTFNRDEIEATREYFARLSDDDEQDAMWPTKSQEVTLTLDAEKQQVSANTLGELHQFRGREYARLLFRKAKERAVLFERVGTVFWYTEQRTTNSLTPIKENGHQIDFDMNLLRRRQKIG